MVSPFFQLFLAEKMEAAVNSVCNLWNPSCAPPVYGPFVPPAYSNVSYALPQSNPKHCIFFGWGKCKFEEEGTCHFRHDPSRKQKDPSTLPCKFISSNEDCPHGDKCWFAHDLIVQNNN